MSVCLETGIVLGQTVSTSCSPPPKPLETIVSKPPSTYVSVSSTLPSEIKPEQQQPLTSTKSIAKLVVTTQHAASTSSNNCNQVLQKVVNPPLITVLNSTGPLTVVKSLCVTSVVSSAPHYTLVNSSPLNVSNTLGKAPTITVLNCGNLSAPVTVVKAITTQPTAVEKSSDVSGLQTIPNNVTLSNNLCITNNNNAPPVAPTILENRGHNVFVKNTCPDSTVPDNIPQSHKLLTANNFPATNVLPGVNQSPKSGTVNGQRSKLKVLSNIVLPGPSQAAPNSPLLNKNNSQQRYTVPPRQKLIGANGAPNKFLNKQPPNNVLKTNMGPSLKAALDKSHSRSAYPTQKSQIKTMPPNNYLQKPQQGIKTLSPQMKNIPGQVQRTGSGLRTIPPQRPHKLANKPNYIGKHAVQAQKMRQGHGKIKNLKMPPRNAYTGYIPPMPEKQLTFNQALTAQIIETLSNSSAPLPSNRYEIFPSRYDSAFNCPDVKQPVELSMTPAEEKAKSGLDALSLICQAVLLDHNYNATLPSESPTRPSPPVNSQAQVNGISANSLYSPPLKRRSLSSSNTVSTSSLSNVSLAPTNSNSIPTSHDDDAASDVSDGSERKHDTEGEETDTAPEAEAVNNQDQFDHYGDYVTRCLCGFVHDDGYMVECDRCKVWQHVQCVVKNRQIPDEYLCEVCDPSKPVDRQKARLTQQQWLRDRQLLDSKLRKENKLKDAFKSKETVSDTESSDGERIVHNNNFVSKGRGLVGRRKSEGPQKTTKREAASEKPLQRRQKRKERKIVKRKTKAQVKQQQHQQQQQQQQTHSDDENQDTWASHLPQLRQWIEKYEEAVTNHYSPELRARISSIRVNGTHCDTNVQFDPTVCKSRVHTQPLTEIKYLVSTHQLTPNTPVIELRGKYMLSTQHRHGGGGSLTTRQHTQRPGPFLFFYRLHKDNTEVCVDTRTYGNSARFIRRSCKPNAELRHCIEKGVLHLYIVSIANVDKNCELTIKHESHDLAAIGTTQIACACGRPDECTVNKSSIKKNGEVPEVVRKRRGRRTTSACLPSPEPVSLKTPTKEELPPLPPVQSPPPVVTPKEEKPEITEPVEVKIEIKEEPVVEVKQEIKEEEEIKDIPIKEEIKLLEEKPVKTEVKKEKVKEEAKSPNPTPVSTRRSSQYKSDKEDSKEIKQKETKEQKSKSKKLSREERKLEAILRAIEQMEKADQRKQEHQAKQAHRRESEPGPTPKEEEKQEPKMKRRRRKGRARTTSTNANSERRCRLNSTDSYMTSGDENLLSPNENTYPPKSSFRESDTSDDRAAGLLLALSNDENIKGDKTPPREVDYNSSSAHSSPETPQLSSACLLVQAAVEPMEPGFKFPKTKKVLMNEWLNKVPEPVQPASSISPSSLLPHISPSSTEVETAVFYSTPAKSLSALAQAATTFCDNPVAGRTGSAKKRWLRQAISEDHSCDSPVSRPDSPPLSDMVAPPKKRRLPRESLSNDNSPPTTPTSTVPPVIKKVETPRSSQEGCVEIVFSGTDGDSPSQTLESDTELKERAAQMKQEYKCVTASSEIPPLADIKPSRLLGDPRLSRDNSNHSNMFSNSEHLVGTVEKTLSIFGFENTHTKDVMPAKQKVKLSITEYRQRKKLSTNDKSEDQDMETEQNSLEDNNSSESFKMLASTSAVRARSDSMSSTTSTSSDDEHGVSDVIVKAPAFNSEPTELERQREISSIRLKKAFGLPLNDETKKPALDVSALLSCELEPKVKPIPLPSPTFPIPGNCDVAPTRAVSPPATSHVIIPATTVADFERSASPTTSQPTPKVSASPIPKVSSSPPPAAAEPMETEPISSEEEPMNKEDEKEETNESEKGGKGNVFYTPDEVEAEEEEQEAPTDRMETSFEDTESVSYVPPFNNPVYPNSNFTSYTSTLDDDARYESRNPSPPPDLETFNATT